MQLKILLSFAFILLLAFGLTAQITIEGGAENAGLLETTINGDTLDTGERRNPNEIYVLKSGEIYLQRSAININNPGGTLTIRGEEGGSKPIVIKQPLDDVAILENRITGSLTLQNIQYHQQQTDGNITFDGWLIIGNNHKLVAEDLLIEHSWGNVFRMEGVLEGGCAEIRNSYFRDLNNFQQWWGGRVLQAFDMPLDTLIFENNTISGGGITIAMKNSLVEYAVVNHNTFINNHKYPFLNVYWKEAYLTNNLFVNANMVGEDFENVARGGQDPDALLHGILGVDTISSGIFIQEKYLSSDGELTEEVDGLDDIILYAADNVVTYSNTLENYYNGGLNSDWDSSPTSYLKWGGMEGPHEVLNVTGIWKNERTSALIEDHDNIKEENNSIYTITVQELGLVTDPLPQEAADVFAVWNRSAWAVPDVAAPSPSELKVYYFGDFDPLTVPGVETETATAGSGGITKISDMVEDFSYSANLISKSDGLRIGALHWNDEDFDREASLAAVKAAYLGTSSVQKVADAKQFELKNQPNPFSNATLISYHLPENTQVRLAVYDLTGKLVQTLVNTTQMAGAHNVEFTPNNVSSGIYIYQLQTEKYIASKQLVILK